MEKCKDCIHCDVCIYHSNPMASDDDSCNKFKHKDSVIGLPVYVGQPVWLLYKYYKEIREGKISMLQQKVDKTWKFRVSRDGSVYDCTAKDINTHVFFSYEEALAKLMEEVD